MRTSHRLSRLPSDTAKLGHSDRKCVTHIPSICINITVFMTEKPLQRKFICKSHCFFIHAHQFPIITLYHTQVFPAITLVKRYMLRDKVERVEVGISHFS